MRDPTGTDKYFPETPVIEVRSEFGHTQIVCSERDYQIRGNWPVPQLVIIPDNAGSPKDLFVDCRQSLFYFRVSRRSSLR